MACPSLVSRSWSHNQLSITKLSHVWTMDKLSYCPEQYGSALVSGTFTDKQDNKWTLHIYPRGCNPNNDPNYVSLFLVLTESKAPVHAKVTFSLINAWNGETTKTTAPQVVSFVQRGQRHGFAQFVEREFLFNEENGLLSEDTLTIKCELDVFGNRVTVSGEDNPVNVPQCDLHRDFSELLSGQQFSDCIICVGGSEFKVHKNILSARSPVFGAMFKHGMLEDQRNRIEIVDIDPDVMQQLIDYIYTGHTPTLDEKMAVDLLAAGDKYKLDRLKTICEETICRGINRENVCEMMLIGDLHSANQIKAHAIQYIKRHLDAVIGSQQWQQIIKHHPRLTTEVFKAIND